MITKTVILRKPPKVHHGYLRSQPTGDLLLRETKRGMKPVMAAVEEYPDPYAIIFLQYDEHRRELSVGWSLRNKTDRWDRRVGVALAKERAAGFKDDGYGNLPRCLRLPIARALDDFSADVKQGLDLQVGLAALRLNTPRKDLANG